MTRRDKFVIRATLTYNDGSQIVIEDASPLDVACLEDIARFLGILTLEYRQ